MNHVLQGSKAILIVLDFRVLGVAELNTQIAMNASQQTGRPWS